MVNPSSTPMISMFGRLFWMMIGPLGLGLALYIIVSSGTGWRTVADLAYFLILGGMILGRLLEYRGGAPLTSDGAPATRAVLRRYMMLVVVVGPAVWVVANVIGNHFLAR